jgi:hypothetical protein
MQCSLLTHQHNNLKGNIAIFKKQDILERTNRLKWHGPHRKRHIPQLFVAVITPFPSFYLATIGEYKVKVKVILRPTVSRPVRLGVRQPSGTSEQFFFLLEIFVKQFRLCYFIAPSLTRGRVCNLLLLLVLASAVPLMSESRGTQDHILL